jgi:hypothetical protein
MPRNRGFAFVSFSEFRDFMESNFPLAPDICYAASAPHERRALTQSIACSESTRKQPMRFASACGAASRVWLPRDVVHIGSSESFRLHIFARGSDSCRPIALYFPLCRIGIHLRSET